MERLRRSNSEKGSSLSLVVVRKKYREDKIIFFLFSILLLSQVYQLPILVIREINWALWPNVPDLVISAMLFYLLIKKRINLSTILRVYKENSFSSILGRLFLIIEILLISNYLIFLFFSTPTVNKYGGYSILVMAKYLAIFTIISHIHLSKEDLKRLHRLMLLLLLISCFSVIFIKLDIIDVDKFRSHLPRGISGRWDAIRLDSLMGATHGETSIYLLMFLALVILSSYKKLIGFLSTFIIGLVAIAIFITGSRQGIVRLFIYCLTLFLLIYKKEKKVNVLGATLLLIYLIFSFNFIRKVEKDYIYEAVQRQNIFIENPFSEEGLSGRPLIWKDIIKVLNSNPIRWVVGFGIGGWAQLGLNAHNMFLQIILDGGLILLSVMIIIYIMMFKTLFRYRYSLPSCFALFAALLSSIFTSNIFYPSISSGWTIALFLITIRIGSNINENNLIMKNKVNQIK